MDRDDFTVISIGWLEKNIDIVHQELRNHSFLFVVGMPKSGFIISFSSSGVLLLLLLLLLILALLPLLLFFNYYWYYYWLLFLSLLRLFGFNLLSSDEPVHHAPQYANRLN